MKTLFVVVVASSNISVELAAVAREDFRDDYMVLPLRANFIVKNQGPRTSPNIEIPNLPGSWLCPNKTLSECLEAIKNS